jgi:DNA-directed RNA polymerase specialized sigma24 family protein
MALPVLGREQLAPLLQGTWTGPQAVFALLTDQRVLLVAAVRRAWGGRSSHPLFQDPQELSQELVLRMVEKVGKRAGLPTPPDWAERHNGSGWLYTVLLHEAQSLLRREKHTVSLDDSQSRPPNPPDLVHTDPAARMIAEQELERLAALREHPAIKTHYLLAFWATEAPMLLKVLPIGELPWTPSLVRPREQCAGLLARWVSCHRFDHQSDGARRELGWILCVDDNPEDVDFWREEVGRWRRERPEDVARVRNLVSKWSGRAAKLLDPL